MTGITLFHVSDLHFGREDRAALNWFADAVERERPDAVLCTGDLTWRGTAKEFSAASAWLLALGVPVHVTPGNHDMPYYWNPLGRLINPYAHFRALRTAVGSDLNLPDLKVVPLRTVARAQLRLNWSKGVVKPAVLRRAMDQLRSGGTAGLRLVTCHHPLIDADTHSTGSTRGGRQALAALAGAGVDAVLSGHVHDAFDMVRDTPNGPIRVIGAGTLSLRLRATRPSYNRLEWSEEKGLEVFPQTMSE